MKTRTRCLAIGLLACLVTLPIAGSVVAQETTQETAPETTTGKIFVHYEKIRRSLAADSTDQVTSHASQIQALLQELREEPFSAADSGIRADQADAVHELIPELAQATNQLVEAESLATARDAFYALSKPLVRLRKNASGDLPIVAYCSMAKRSWLQPSGEIGNPYYGSTMPVCGEVVDG